MICAACSEDGDALACHAIAASCKIAAKVE
jgi:hypothetical protein